MDYPLSFFATDDVSTPPTELIRRTLKTSVRKINAVSAEYEIMAGTVRCVAGRLHIGSRLQRVGELAPRDEKTFSIEKIDRIAKESRRNLNLSVLV